MPYITKIGTALSKAYVRKDSVYNRSALGDYPVRRDEVIEISGFNLKSGETAPTVNAKGVKTTNSNTSETNITLTLTDSSVNLIKAKIEDSSNNKYPVKSGELSVTVSGVTSLNNKTSKSVTTSTGENAITRLIEYNQEPNGLNNDLLTDARILRVWKMQSRSTKAVRYPTMRVGKDSAQTVGFIYDNVATVQMNKDGSDFQIDDSYSQWYCTGLAIDNAGRFYGVSQNGDTGGPNGNKGYAGNTGTRHANSMFYAWNTETQKGSHYSGTTAAYYDGGKKVAIENLYNGSQNTPERVRNPKIVTIATKDNAESDASAYVVYFDSAENQIKFRYGTVTGKESNESVTFNGALASHANNGTGSGAGYQVIAGNGASRTNNTTGMNNTNTYSDYAAVGVVPNVTIGNQTKNVAVVAWYDNEGQRLLYSYNENPQNYGGTTNDSKNEWGDHTTEIETDSAGWYVDMVVDKAGGIHIAYYGASGGDLKYAYLPAYNRASEKQLCTVDSYLSVGTNISIEVPDTQEDILTATGSTIKRYIPRISYYLSALTKTKYSLRTAMPYRLGENNKFIDGVNSNDSFTGAWEAMSVPTASIPLDYTVGIGIKKNDNNTDSILLGYGTTTGLETAALQ